ncbi:hypothetical protein JRQ81_015490 [Phrynocephalus forsythii]|uniref:Solute carrier family 2, facilitated glucose transporter member 5 n=1 Tax=Phrynocephalus forsythii TaxID=171643 RepID=A0A9Q1B1G9_9SAUR|nr:hypothetical protein JRQ81_015490 [Phrynocephalus forsythii]
MANICSDLVLYRRVIQMSLVLALGGSFLFGFQVAVINFTSPYVKKLINDTFLERYNAPVDEQMLTFLWSFIVSAFNIGGLLGSCISGYLSAKYGKKKCLMFSSILMLVAAAMSATSKTAKSFEMILVGRLLYGFCSGLGTCIQGQYLSEISPKHRRGAINVTLAIFVNMGKFLAQLAGQEELLGTESLWPCLLAIGGPLGLVILTTVPLFPESPPHLLIQEGDLEGCLKAMRKLWGEGNHKEEVDDMLKEQASMKQVKIMNVLQLLRDTSMRRQVYLLITVSCAVSLSGISAIYFYASDVFSTAGFRQDLISYVTLGVGACELCSTFLCLYMIEHFGRRKLLLWGYGLMILALALLTATLSLQHQAFWLPYCNTVLVFLFIMIYAMAPAGSTFPLIVELFTQTSRPAALIITMILHWIGTYLVGMVFPYLVLYLDNFCFLVFMGCIAIAWTILFCWLPETKGKSLVEIQGVFLQMEKKKKEAAMTNNLPEDASLCTKL